MLERIMYGYFKKKTWVTTRGPFSTYTLKYVVDKIDIEKVLFSVDYPY